MRTYVLTSLLVVVCAASETLAADIPPHPEQITFNPLEFEAPRAADYRHTLPGGVTVYLAPSHEFPLINVVFTFKAGQYLDAPDQIGLASATGAMIRRGGTTTHSAQELDEEFDFLAAQCNTFVGDIQSGASLNCLSANFDESFALFIDMLRNPGFQGDRLGVFKDEVIEGMKQRNDDAGSILSREWSALMYGRNHFEAAQPTQASLQSITVDTLRAMHRRIFHPAPGHLIIAINGDFEEQEMLSHLQRVLEGWDAGEVPPPPPTPTASFEPGVYQVEKDIPQGKVYIGLRGTSRDDPDYFSTLLMNHILGGSGFTSRITNRVRSDEGLAYSAGSSLQPRVYFPGEFRAGFQSKNRTVALATKIIFEEFDRIRTDPVTEEELNTSVNSLIETFPRTFESKAGMLGVFVNDELTNRPEGYWKNYRDNVRAVTAEDITRVAQKYLLPDQMAIMIVGKWEEIAPGDLDGRASMSEFFNGAVTHLPLRDPLTLEPIQ